MLLHLVIVCVSGDGEHSTRANAWVWKKKKRDGKRRRKGAKIETERVQETESEGGEGNWGGIRRRMREAEAKLQGLAASFHQTDSKLGLPLSTSVCIQLHKSPYACAPLVWSSCWRLWPSSQWMWREREPASTRADDNAESNSLNSFMFTPWTHHISHWIKQNKKPS